MAPRPRRTIVIIGFLAILSLSSGCGQPAVTVPGQGSGRFSKTDIATLPDMLQGLKSKDASTRARSAATIGGMGPAAKEAVPALITLLKDREVSVQAAGAHALGQIGPDAAAARSDLEALTRQGPLRDVAVKAIQQIEKR